MTGARTVTAALVSSALLYLAGCVETRGALTSSAERLDHSAQALARGVSSDEARRDEALHGDYPNPGYPSSRDYPSREYPSRGDYPGAYPRDADVLATDAHDFRRVAESRRASDADIKAAFERVSRSYHVVRDEVEHADNRELQMDFKPVTDAYLDVEREIGGYPERHARAADYPPRY